MKFEIRIEQPLLGTVVFDVVDVSRERGVRLIDRASGNYLTVVLQDKRLWSQAALFVDDREVTVDEWVSALEQHSDEVTYAEQS